jgi:hypothetical protein
VGACDVPLVLLATRLFRGIHPVSPEMDPQMRIVLLVSVVSFTALFGYLVFQRQRQLGLVDRVTQRSDQLVQLTVADVQ